MFLRAFTDGVGSKDYFGYAAGKEGDSYLGFKFGEGMLLAALDDQMLAVSKKRAIELDEARQCPKCGQYPCKCQSKGGGGKALCPICGKELDKCTCQKPPQGGNGDVPTDSADKRHYFGTVNLDPLDPVMKMSDVLENVISLFTAKPGVHVTVKLDIEASSTTPFDKNTIIRPVSENGKALGFTTSEFSAE